MNITNKRSHCCEEIMTKVKSLLKYSNVLKIWKAVPIYMIAEWMDFIKAAPQSEPLKVSHKFIGLNMNNTFNPGISPLHDSYQAKRSLLWYKS